MKQHLLRPVFAALLVCSAAVAAQADTAIVVGINRYPKLSSESQLRGPVNDAENMAERLRRYGFDNIIVLKDGEATKQGILNKLRNSGNRSNQRFAFFFAGHGTNSGDRGAIIMPSDAGLDETTADLSADELKKAVDAVPASTRTVILDSCFSGSMTRVAKSIGKGKLRSRFVKRRTSTAVASANRMKLRSGGEAKDIIRNNANGGGGNEKVSSVCYVVAAGPEEKAVEDEFGGRPAGVFTHFLTQQLDGSKKPWGEVMDDVVGNVKEYLQGIQVPEMTPEYSGKVVFEGGGGKVDPGPLPRTLWDLYNSQQPDTSIIDLRQDPGQKELKVGETFYLNATVGRTGYLIVLELGTSGKVNLLYPEKPNLADAEVAPGPINLDPEGFHPDAPGTEQVKAIYVKDKETAQSILSAFSGAESPRLRQLRSTRLKRDLKRNKIAPNDNRTFVTSDLVFGVTDN